MVLIVDAGKPVQILCPGCGVGLKPYIFTHCPRCGTEIPKQYQPKQKKTRATRRRKRTTKKRGR